MMAAGGLIVSGGRTDDTARRARSGVLTHRLCETMCETRGESRGSGVGAGQSVPYRVAVRLGAGRANSYPILPSP